MKPGTDEEADVADILARLEAATAVEAAAAVDGEQEETVVALLASIKPVLVFSETRLKYKESLERCDLVILFRCLGRGASVGEAAAEVLAKILEFLDPEATLNKYSVQLGDCLLTRKPQPEVVVGPCPPLVALRFLRRCLSGGDAASRALLLADKSLLAAACRTLALSQPAELVRESKLFLLDLAGRAGGAEILFGDPAVLQVLLDLKEDPNDVVRLRVLEVMVQVAKLSPEMTESVAKAGFLSKLHDEEIKRSDDILLQLNALEILSDLAQVPHGLEYLMDRKIFAQLDRMLDRSSSPNAGFLMAGFLKFFGRLAHGRPQMFMESYPNFTAILFDLVSGRGNPDEEAELVSLAVATLGHISTTSAGKGKLLETASLANAFVERLSVFLRYGKTDQKILAFQAASEALGSDSDQDDDDDDLLTGRFYAMLISKVPDFPKRVLDSVKLPFDDLAAAGYEVLIKAADKPWGLKELIAGQPGMIEHLLNRRSASSRDAKLARYAVIKAVVGNRVASDSDAVPPELLVRMKSYLSEGPFYVEPEAAVALDEG